jgi:hypothetical protein
LTDSKLTVRGSPVRPGRRKKAMSSESCLSVTGVSTPSPFRCRRKCFRRFNDSNEAGSPNAPADLPAADPVHGILDAQLVTVERSRLVGILERRARGVADERAVPVPVDGLEERELLTIHRIDPTELDQRRRARPDAHRECAERGAVERLRGREGRGGRGRRTARGPAAARGARWSGHAGEPGTVLVRAFPAVGVDGAHPEPVRAARLEVRHGPGALVLIDLEHGWRRLLLEDEPEDVVAGMGPGEGDHAWGVREGDHVGGLLVLVRRGG